MRQDEDGYFQGPPDLAIEVVSPSEPAADVERKFDLMIAAEARAIWVVYPRSRHVWVHTTGASRLFVEGEMLSAPELLPASRCRCGRCSRKSAHANLD